MIENIKWWLNRIWNGKELYFHGNSRRGVISIESPTRGLKGLISSGLSSFGRWLLKIVTRALSESFSVGLAFVVGYLLGKLLK